MREDARVREAVGSGRECDGTCLGGGELERRELESGKQGALQQRL